MTYSLPARCEKHAVLHAARERQRKREYEKRRPPRAVSLTGPAWREARARHLAAHPACVDCGAVRPDNHVDHIVPERVAPDRALDPGNFATRCPRCHASKTNATDGGFGNPRRA